MTDKKSIESRRKLLKSIAAGSGAIVAGKSLPESWSRPVVDSVVLPAHAQTSGCTITMVVLDPAGAPVPSGTQIYNAGEEYTFTGTVIPAEAGAGGQVTLSWSAPDGSAGQATGIIDATGNWSIGPMLLDYGELGTDTTYVATTGCAITGATWYFTTID
jgi:hypothetical protein